MNPRIPESLNPFYYKSETRNQKPETKAAGIYIHIPFCIKKCHYCDFYSITDHSLIEKYVESLALEMEMHDKSGLVFDTIYIGGGTPSVLKTAQLFRIIEKAFFAFQITSDPEITLEANPGTVTFESLRSFKDSGINRINIGIQSFENANLRFLGRIHSAEDGETAVKLARDAGFDNLGLDLMSGLPEQSKKAWISELGRAVRFEPDHLSCYMLTYEAGTRMHSDMKSGIITPLPEDDSASIFETTTRFLEKAGYIHYEISNFASSVDKQSRHNLKYWSHIPYIGLGPSAHSFNGTARSWNVKSVSDYIKKIGAGTLPLEGSEALTREQRIIEAVFLGFRQKSGIDIRLFNEKFNLGFRDIFSEAISDLSRKGLITVNNDKCALTEKGTVLLDTVCAEFVCREL
ncbi:MAG: radical SAM family heme chaperone HemW [Desulfobacteraceae bacterium]|nr:MAG: radical SAM family heme chaperone HemW [Desulfobacteraceae bacterium]